MPLKVEIKFHMRAKFELAEDKNTVRVTSVQSVYRKATMVKIWPTNRGKSSTQRGHKCRNFRISVSKLYEKQEPFTRRFLSEASRHKPLRNTQHNRGLQKEVFHHLVSFLASVSCTISCHPFGGLHVFHAPSGFRTRDPNKQVATDLRLSTATGISCHLHNFT